MKLKVVGKISLVAKGWLFYRSLTKAGVYCLHATVFGSVYIDTSMITLFILGGIEI